MDHETRETHERKPKGIRRLALVFSRGGVSAERRHFPCSGPSVRPSAEAPLRGLAANHHAFHRNRAACCLDSLIQVLKVGPAIFLGLLGFLCPIPAWSQSASPWRVFRSDDGLSETAVTSVSVSSRGNVWMTHATATEASVFDGYAIRHIPAPEENGRIVESQLGQIWSMYSDGVQEFREGRWVKHPVREVALDYQTYPMRRVRSRQLLPTERDRVLLLVADQLMEYNAANRQTRTLKRSAGTRLGLFQDLGEARDGGIWVSGARGLARISGLPRTWEPALEWREWLLPELAPVCNLQNPIEDEEGGVVAVAESTTVSERFLVWFEGQGVLPQMAPVGKVRQGWRGWDDLFWVQTFNSVSRLDLAHLATLPGPEGFLASSYYDVAVQPKGVFWLATSDGLVRYAPPLWRTPAALRPRALPVYAMVESENGTVWIMDAQGLRRCLKEEWQTYPFPEEEEFFFQPTDSMEELPNGNLAFTASGSGYVFDPITRVFSRPADFLLKTVRWLGPLPNGDLGVQVLDPGGSDNTLRIHAFDGKQLRLYLELGTNEMVGRELNFVRIYRYGDGWVGGARGVGLWREGRWQTPGAPQREKPDSAYVWLEVGDGRFWCGSAGKIYKLNGQSWSVVRSGFDRVHQMRKGRDGTIWVASRSGLFRYRNGSWLMHGVEEGLPAESVNTVLEDRAGRLWAGTSRGLSRLYPETDMASPKTFILQDNLPQEVLAGTPLTMVFGGVDRWKATPAERLLYSYRLDQGTWSSYKSVPLAFLQNLPAGSHRFEARAMDRNGNEGTEPAIWEFTVRPALRTKRPACWSLHRWVWCSLCFWPGLAVNRHWRLRRSYAEVERMVEQRTRELEKANQALLHSQKMEALGTLAAGIAHDFNNILSIVKGSAQIIENHLDDKNKRSRRRVKRIKTVQISSVVKAMLNFGKPAPKEISACDVNALVLG